MSVVLTPRITEKAMALSEQGIYVFDVPTAANKTEVAKAVELAFKVKVADVNIMVTKGKLKRFKQVPGRRRDSKKALVKLRDGHKITLLEAAE